MDWLEGVDAHWLWLTFGLILAALEMLVPGVNLLWFAVAAIGTAGLTYLLDLSLPIQLVDFGFLALIALYSARRFLRDKPIVGADPNLNRRGAQLVGQQALVVKAIEHGAGRIRLGDSEWIAYGPDIATDQWVRVTGSEGTALRVEPLGLLADESSGTPEPS